MAEGQTADGPLWQTGSLNMITSVTTSFAKYGDESVVMNPSVLTNLISAIQWHRFKHFAKRVFTFFQVFFGIKLIL